MIRVINHLNKSSQINGICPFASLSKRALVVIGMVLLDKSFAGTAPSPFVAAEEYGVEGIAKNSEILPGEEQDHGGRHGYLQGLLQGPTLRGNAEAIDVAGVEEEAVPESETATKEGAVQSGTFHGPDFLTSSDQLLDANEASTSVKDIRSKWNCFSKSDLSYMDSVEIDWGHQHKDATWACNQWTRTGCADVGGCTTRAVATWGCYPEDESPVKGHVSPWWGRGPGDATWACNEWVEYCRDISRCEAALRPYVTVDKFKCIEETDEFGSDEIFITDGDAHKFGEEPKSNVKAAFRDVDNGETVVLDKHNKDSVRSPITSSVHPNICFFECDFGNCKTNVNPGRDDELIGCQDFSFERPLRVYRPQCDGMVWKSGIIKFTGDGSQYEVTFQVECL